MEDFNTITNNKQVTVISKINVSLEDRNDPQFCKTFTNLSLLKTHLEEGGFGYEVFTNQEEYGYCKPFFDFDAKIAGEELKEGYLSEYLSEDELQHCFKKIVHIFSNIFFKEGSILYVDDNSEKKKYIETEELLTKIKSKIFKRLAYTVSSDRKKQSIHLFFPNVLIHIDDLVQMRSYLEREIRLAHEDNSLSLDQITFIKSLDLALYKGNPSLRVPYSKKSNKKEDTSFHEIHTSTEEHDCFFTYIDNWKKIYFVFEMQRKKTLDPLAEGAILSVEKCRDNEAHFFIIDALEKEFQKPILNKGQMDLMNGNTEIIIVDYSLGPCALCGKAMHKNQHKVHVSNGGYELHISKWGNRNNCQSRTISLAEPNEYDLAMAIVSKNDIKRVGANEYIIWNGDYWEFEQTPNKITGYLCTILDEFPGIIKEGIMKKFSARKMIESNIKDILMDRVEIDCHPEKFYFTNGVFDLVTQELLSKSEGKNFVPMFNCGYKYSPLEGEEIEAAYKHLNEIIDQIQPRLEENLENRNLYEMVCSSTLYGTNKPFVTFFHGDTAAGKTTTKKILKAALGPMMAETASGLLFENIDGRGPNPFIASMNYKRCTFASEIPDTMISPKKICSVNIKKLTEARLIGRMCHSNQIEQTNNNTIIVDTNFQPFFDAVDNALIRRCVLVSFNSFFGDVKKGNHLFSKSRRTFPLDTNLEYKFKEYPYQVAAFHILKEWFLKHFVKEGGKVLIPFYSTPLAFDAFKFKENIGNIVVKSNKKHRVLLTEPFRLDGLEIYAEDANGNPCLEIPHFKTILKAYFKVRGTVNIYSKCIDELVNEYGVEVGDEMVYVGLVFKDHLKEIQDNYT